MRQPIIMGNWKMNGTVAMAKALAGDIASDLPTQLETAVFPPFVYLRDIRDVLADTNVGFGGQDISLHDSGAYTGEISAEMLKDIGAQYALIGHSERRQYHNETNANVAVKTQKALVTGLIPVVCIGETLEQRESGQMEAIIEGQLKAVLDALNDHDLEKCVIAYEPVWAIGTGVTATPEQAQSAHEMIRAMIAKSSPMVAKQIRIVYGGSVKPGNAKALLGLPDIDGALVGGASLKADDFIAICQACE